MQAWDDAVHALGVAEMDATHREFIALVNLLAACDDTDFAALFEKLLDHCRLHFTSEGRLMRISRFPALNEHESEHHRVYGDLVQMNRAVPGCVASRSSTSSPSASGARLGLNSRPSTRF